jgi:hypothetical protein
LETVKNAANWFKASLVTQLAPAIENISKKISEWVRQNKDGLIKGLQTAFDWLTKIVTMVVRVGQVINQVIISTVGWKNALIGIGVAFIALNAAVALPVAGILILMAILEDLAVYSRGGKSAFGHLVSEFPALGKVFDTAFSGIKGVGEAIKAIFTGDFSKLDEMVQKWGLFGDVLEVVARALNLIKDAVSGESIKASFEGIQKKGFLQEYADEWGNLFKMVTNMDWLGQKNKTASIPSNSTTTVTVAPNITVVGATDPKATGQAVKTALTNEVGKAYTQGQSPKREKPY